MRQLVNRIDACLDWIDGIDGDDVRAFFRGEVFHSIVGITIIISVIGGFVYLIYWAQCRQEAQQQNIQGPIQQNFYINVGK